MRLLVVSHPAVVDVNQTVYRELLERDWEVTVVVPSRWRHEYADSDVSPTELPGMEGRLLRTAVVLVGRPQRHLYRGTRAICARVRPDVAFLEAEPYALAAAQWGRTLRRAGVPFGVQCYENIDRPLPWPVRRLRSRVLRDAAFVAARSASAARLAEHWGAAGEVAIAPPAVPSWDLVPSAGERPFTIGYAGRLTASKGLSDLLDAVRGMTAPVELLMAGDGEERGRLEGAEIPGSRVQVITGLAHDEMAAVYARFDVLVLPSRTTPTWKEQFGRVIIEALWCGVPVIGSDSGEIPWLIELTGGGLVFPEGDRAALLACLQQLRDSPQVRAELAERGRAAVERLFTPAAASDALERLLNGALQNEKA